MRLPGRQVAQRPGRPHWTWDAKLLKMLPMKRATLVDVCRWWTFGDHLKEICCRNGWTCHMATMGCVYSKNIHKLFHLLAPQMGVCAQRGSQAQSSIFRGCSQAYCLLHICLLATKLFAKKYTRIDPKQHKLQKNHMSALCHAHRFLWFPCMGLCSVMSIDLRLWFFFCAALPPPGCFQSKIILLWIVAHVYCVHKLLCWCADTLMQCYGHRLTIPFL